MVKNEMDKAKLKELQRQVLADAFLREWYYSTELSLRKFVESHEVKIREYLNVSEQTN